MSFDHATLDRYPQLPGVYLMKDIKGTILYVGKAKNLKQRIRQYFVAGRDARPQIPFLVAKVEMIEVIIVANEKEALLLESTLIKKHQPRYNILLRDDKSYLAIKINHKHPWPMVTLNRYKGRPKEEALYFGPYTSSYAARQTLDLIQKHFPLRQCSDQELERRSRPCILHGMKRCIAPCVQRCTQEEYQTLVQQVIQLLKGQDKEVIKQLKEEMQRASEALEFEKAGQILRALQAIEKIVESQRVDQINGKDLDVIALYREGSDALLTQMSYRQGRLMGANHFPFSKVIEEDEELITSFLLQRYAQKEDYPPEIMLNVEIAESHLVAEIIRQDQRAALAILFPQKGERKKRVDLALENAKSAFAQKREAKQSHEELLLSLKEKLNLKAFPERIECYDNSNLSGKDPVAALVTFVDGVKEKRGFRKFKLEPDAASDDYRALEEVLRRRLSKVKMEGGILPDLVIIDGGKGHLNTALRVFSEFNLPRCDIIGLAKEGRRHDKGITLEKVFTTYSDQPLILPFNAPELFFLQRVRDEAHRFVIEFQKKQRSKTTTKSALDIVPGIGPKKKKALLTKFGSVHAIKGAPDEEILAIKGLAQKDIENLRFYLGN